jgi:heme oxygenase
VVARLIERLHAETEVFHAEADEDALQLLGPVAVADYWRYLTRCFGFVGPVERGLAATARLDQIIDIRRFHKGELIRSDLASLRMKKDEIEALPQCSVPLFDSVEEALGWAYVVERSTLGNHNLFRHLAAVMPGEIAFSSSYLKCYFGAVGEMWRAFGQALDRVGNPPSRGERVVEAAKTAFRTYRAWRHHQDEHEITASQSGEQRSA